MKFETISVDPERIYRAKEYWTGLAQGIPSKDPSGFAPILHPEAPAWFNELIDHLQFRAVRRALALAGIHKDARILDIGCGTGRWLRRYEELGLESIGIDATPSMLRLGRERGTTAPVVAAEAQRLPFLDGQFDCVSDITVTQHIPEALQTQALCEMVRVLKPGGRLILMELIRGKGPHIFPRRPADWIALVSMRGVKLLCWFGQEYALLDRLLVHAAQAITASNGSSAATPGNLVRVPSRHSSFARRIYWECRRITVPISAWADPIIEKVCPRGLATHGVFVFQK